MYCYFTLFFKNLLKKIIIKWAGLAWGMLLAKCITLMPIVEGVGKHPWSGFI